MERVVRLANGSVLCVDERGDAHAPLILQIEGHMAQLVSTPETYVDRLVEIGYRVVRVDNRDVGRSARFDGAAYTLADMAEDLHHLLADLGGPAVVCGRSMGGAVAQLLALAHPDDVVGLGLFFTWAGSMTGGLEPEPRPAPFRDEESFLAWELDSLPRIAGSAHPFGRDEIETLARHLWQRGVSWDGYERQRRAIATTPPWASRLGEIAVPAVVVHGTEDPVIPVSAGEQLAGLIPGAELRLVDGMGHQQPPALDEFFLEATVAVCP